MKKLFALNFIDVYLNFNGSLDFFGVILEG
jgi:hypothetical protein